MLFLILFFSLWSSIRACAHDKGQPALRSLLDNYNSSSHHRTACGTHSPTDEEQYEMAVAHDEWMKHNQDRDLQTTQYRVYVYWHVIQRSNGKGKFSKSKINAAMDMLRNKFANTPFVFEVRGTRSVKSDEWNFCTERVETEMKKKLRVAGRNVLNIYVCDVYSARNGQTGTAYFPPTAIYQPVLDGVILGNGGEAGITLVHEVGHWLGLFHTWEGQCSPGRKVYIQGAEGYSISGDGVSDTPAHTGPSYDLPGWSNCYVGQRHNTCPDNVAGVDPGPDPVLNLMNYGTVECLASQGYFTYGQLQRMVSQFVMYRNVGGSPPPMVTTTTTTKKKKKCKRQRRKCRKSRDCCGALKCKRKRCR